MRKEQWPDLMIAEVDRHANRPFKYGDSDCLMFALDVVREMTGTDLMKGQRSYTTLPGAIKKLKKLGYSDIAEALADKLEEIPPAMAGRGDVGVIDGDGYKVAVVFTGPHAVGKDVNGVTSVSRSAVSRAFRVP